TIGSASGELRLQHSDGSVRICEVRATGLVDESAWWGAVLNIQDISEKRKLELELRLAQKLESVGQLAAGIAHEINTPVQSISNTLVVAANEYKHVAEVGCDLGQLPFVHGNAGDLNQVLLNLIVNASHAIADTIGDSGEPGRIEIRTRADHGDVTIAVSDT